MEATDWKPQAEAACDAVAEAIAPRLKTAADDLYADLLCVVQDYLKENVLHNVRSEVEAANRQALYDRQRAIKAEANVTALVEALKEAHKVVAACRRTAMCEVIGGNHRFEGVPEILKDDLARVDAAISQAEGGE